jgi:hypothetical protein
MQFSEFCSTIGSIKEELLSDPSTNKNKTLFDSHKRLLENTVRYNLTYATDLVSAMRRILTTTCECLIHTGKSVSLITAVVIRTCYVPYDYF